MSEDEDHDDDYRLDLPHPSRRLLAAGEPPARWPFRHIKRQRDGADTGVIAITAPMTMQFPSEDVSGFQEFERLRRAGYRFVGMSSYQEFPGRIINPHQNGEKEPWFEAESQVEAARSVLGWMTCGRDERSVIPPGLDPIPLSESDFSDPARLPSARDVPKLYDFIYFCKRNLWVEHCRNWALACRLVPILVQEFGLSIVIVGRTGADNQRLGMPVLDGGGIHYRDWLQWHDFQRLVAQCRFVFMPNVSDASPRLMTEGFCRDLPVLCNRRIHGGWKYLNAYTSATFSSEADFRPAVRQLLQRDATGQFRPRDYFTGYQRAHRPGHALAAYVKRCLAKAEKRREVGL